MKKKLACGFIALYLSCLGWGIVSYTLQVGTASHPGMYYVIWDMFCGWSSFSQRFHLVAEGESGKYYLLNPAPWGHHTPYGGLGREQYDTRLLALHRMANKVLEKTNHEPIARILVVEECWNKRYNLPEPLWSLRNPGEEKDRQVYRRVRLAFTPQGELLFLRPSFLDDLATRSVGSNPRLQADSRRSRPIFALEGGNNYRGGAVVPFQSRELSNSAH